jgi:hypothetical protein
MPRFFLAKIERHFFSCPRFELKHNNPVTHEESRLVDERQTKQGLGQSRALRWSRKAPCPCRIRTCHFYKFRHQNLSKHNPSCCVRVRIDHFARPGRGPSAWCESCNQGPIGARMERPMDSAPGTQLALILLFFPFKRRHEVITL